MDLRDKASLQDLAELEARLEARIADLLNQLSAQFADKDGTRKKIFNLEKNVSNAQKFMFKNLYDLMMAANENKGSSTEDAMFTRKPVGPVACASCEKGIVNLLGTQADYLAWKKLPFREPNERIAKYG
jgi:hypothetical protein